MARTMAFDTLAYAKKLKSVGFSEEQAEVQVSALAELVVNTLATKSDIKELEMALKELKIATKRDLKELEMANKRDLKELEMATKRDLKELEIHLKYDLTIRLGTMMAASIAIMATIVKLL